MWGFSVDWRWQLLLEVFLYIKPAPFLSMTESVHDIMCHSRRLQMAIFFRVLQTLKGNRFRKQSNFY